MTQLHGLVPLQIYCLQVHCDLLPEQRHSTSYSDQATFLTVATLLLADKLVDFLERKLKLSNKHLKILLPKAQT